MRAASRVTKAWPAAWLDSLGRKEELHQHLVAGEAGILEDPPELRLLQVHDVLTTLRGGADQQHLADEGGALERDLLRDHAAEGEAEQIHLA